MDNPFYLLLFYFLDKLLTSTLAIHDMEFTKVKYGLKVRVEEIFATGGVSTTFKDEETFYEKK